MLRLEQMIEIQILHKQGYSNRAIAKELGISRNTVKKHINATSVGYKDRKGNPSKLDDYKQYLQDRIKAAHPDWIPATVLYREIQDIGYTGKIRILNAYVAQFKQAPAQPIIRYETLPGKQMQVDWAEFRKGKNRLCALIATMGFSRASYVEYVTDEKINTLLSCLSNAFDYFGGVPKDVLFDNMKTVVIQRDAYGAGKHRFNSNLWDYAKHYGFIPKLCKPYRPQTKGKVERFIGYLRRSFYVPLKATLSAANLQVDSVTANQEVRKWLVTANSRIHATTGLKPVDQLHKEQAHLQSLPDDYNTIAVVPADNKTQKLVSLDKYSSLPIQHNLSIYDELLAVAVGVA
jgi:transposase